MTAKWKEALKHLRLGMQVKVTSAAKTEDRPVGSNNWRRKCMYTLLPEPVFGVVVGAVYRTEGILRWYRRNDFDDPARHHLEVENRVLLVKVATSWSGKPIEAAPSNVISMHTCFTPNRLMPWSPYKMPDSMREAVSNDSKNWPRDKRGRFIPEEDWAKEEP